MQGSQSQRRLSLCSASSFWRLFDRCRDTSYVVIGTSGALMIGVEWLFMDILTSRGLTWLYTDRLRVGLLGVVKLHVSRLGFCQSRCVHVALAWLVAWLGESCISWSGSLWLGFLRSPCFPSNGLASSCIGWLAPGYSAWWCPVPRRRCIWSLVSASRP